MTDKTLLSVHEGTFRPKCIFSYDASFQIFVPQIFLLSFLVSYQQLGTFLILSCEKQRKEIC